MALFKVFKGNSANLPEEMHDGYCYFTMDDGIFYIDYLDTDGTTLKRKPISGPGKSIEYIVGTQSADTNVWLGVTKDEALYTGKIIAYKLPVAGTSTAATLTLTLSNNTTTAAIPVKRKGSGNVTTHYSAGEVLFLAYDGTNWQVNADYYSDSNDTTTGYSRFAYGQFAPTTALYRYQILLSHPTDSSKLIPVNTTSNSTGTAKTTITTASFNPFEPFYYYSTTGTVNANTLVSVSYIWNVYSRVNIRYSFNTGETLVANKDVYLVAQMQSDGSAKLRNPGATNANASAQATGANAGPITQILPTSDDGYIYIKFGHAADNYRVSMTFDHPIYKYIDGKVQLWAPYAEKTKQTMALTNPNKLIQTATENGNTVLKTIENSYVDYETGKITLGVGFELTNNENLYVYGSVAEGVDTEANNYSHAEGDSTKAFGNCSHAEGQETITLGDSSHAEGIGITKRTVQAQCTNSEERMYRLNSTLSSDVFLENKAIVEYDGEYYNIIEISSNIIRLDRLIKNNSSFSDTVIIHASGAFGEASHVEGYSTMANGYQSHSEGKISRASGYSSHAEGGYTWAFGENSHAQGHSTKAFGHRAHTEGNKTVAVAGNAHAEGVSNKAQAPNAHAEGNHTIAGGKDEREKPYGQASHAEGEFTRAYGDFSHVEGLHTKVAKGANSAHAEGRYSYASGVGAHAEGSSAALGKYSHAEGGAYCISYIDEGDYARVLSKGSNENICTWTDDIDEEVPSSYLKVGQIISCKGLTGIIESISDENSEITISGNLEEISLDNDFIYILPTSSGNYSHAEGSQTIASGNSSHAEGSYTIASGDRSHAEGNYTIASGSRSHAEGNYTKAIENSSHAEGYFTTATGVNSHAEGKSTIASGSQSHAEGNYAKSLGFTSHAEGSYTEASGNYSHAEGENTRAKGLSSHAEGCSYTKNNNAIKLSKTAGSNICTWTKPYEGTGIIPIGGNDFTTNDYSDFQVGQLLKYSDKTGEVLTVDVENKTLTVDGDLVSISIPSSGSITVVNNAKQKGNHTEGIGTAAVGLVSHAEGFSTVALGDCSHSEGKNTTASGNNSHAEGFYTKAFGRYSHAEGYNTIASRSDSTYGSSHAEGYNTRALGDCSHAEGQYTIAKSEGSHSEGSASTSNGTFTFSTGNSSSIITSETTVFEKGQVIYYNDKYVKISSVTEGNPHEARIDGSFSANLENVTGKFIRAIAYGYSSHSEGYNNIASGSQSHAEGWNTNAYSDSQHVFGKYNISDAENTYVEIVGNGTSNSSRSNARTLDWDGNEVLAGKLTIGANPTAAMDVVTKQYLENNTSDTKVIQTALSDNADLKILTTVSASPTSGAAAQAGYNANLAYNPSTGTLKGQNETLTGTLTVTGQTTLNSNVTAQGITTTDLLVSGNTTFNQIPLSVTPADTSNDTSVATTEFVKRAFQANDAMVFKGTLGSGSGSLAAPPASGYSAGWTYRVADAGTYAGEYCEVGDILIAIKDGPATGSSVINADWAKIEHNIDGAVYMGHAGSAIGGTTQPVYVNANGLVVAGTALGGAAYKAADYYLPLSGGTMIGGITLPGNQSSAWNDKGIIFSGGSRIGENNSGQLGLYSANKFYLRPNSGTASSGKGVEIDNTFIIPTVTNEMSLGDSTHKWTTVYATTFNGNATSATILQNSRTIWGQSFNGSANISGNMTNVGNITHTDETQECFLLNKKKENAGGWAYAPLILKGNDETIFARLAVYGVDDTLHYIYLGANGYSATTNLRIYPDGKVSAAKFVGDLDKSLTLKINTGTTEGTSLYTFNNSANKIINIKTEGITATAAAGEVTLSGTTVTFRDWTVNN